MGFENSVFPHTSGTAYNHYGQRDIGGYKGGEINTVGAVPAGAIVTEIVDFYTGSISAATVGAQDISAANGAVANYVTVSVLGDLTITGPTAGTAVVKYTYIV